MDEYKHLTMKLVSIMLISTENNLFCFLLRMQVEFVLGVALHERFFSGFTAIINISKFLLLG